MSTGTLVDRKPIHPRTRQVTDPDSIDFYLDPTIDPGHKHSSASIIGGGGLYASLTGPGETTTPGELTQAGPFVVQAGSAVDSGINAGIVLATTAALGGVYVNDQANIWGVRLVGGTDANGILLDGTGTGGGAVEIAGGDSLVDTAFGSIDLLAGNISLVSTGTFITLSGNSSSTQVQAQAHNGQLNLNDYPNGWDVNLFTLTGGTQGMQILDQGSGGIFIFSGFNQSTQLFTANTRILVNAGGDLTLTSGGNGNAATAITALFHGTGGFCSIVPAEGKLMFFQNGPVGGAPQQTVTGALSSVTDANAKAVLTSLIAAFETSTGYGLIVNGTT